jgi:glycosyltransferase involved in cell wall biosynthesis
MDKRLRIVHIMTATGGVMGEVERHTFDLCSALAEKHEVHLLADKSYAATCPKNIIFHAIDFRQSQWNPWLYWQIAQLINHLQPQLIHAQSARATYLVSKMKWFFQHVIFVATVHCYPNNKAYLLMDGVITTNTSLAVDVPIEKKQVIYRCSKWPATLMPHEKKDMRQALLAGAERPLIIAVGRLVPDSGFDVLLRACVDVDATLLIVGSGAERKRLAKLTIALGLQERVLWLGQRHDMGQLLQAVDLCVISSISDEFPSIMTDALQVGCPVISTDKGGVSDWLSDALLCPANNVEALHTLLCDTLRRLPLLRKNYLPIFLRAQQELTIATMTQHTQDFYSALLEQRR